MGGLILALLILIVMLGVPFYLIKTKAMRLFLATSGLITAILLTSLMLGGEILGVNLGYTIATLINFIILTTLFVVICFFAGRLFYTLILSRRAKTNPQA